jgi:hypothetical protein
MALGRWQFAATGGPSDAWWVHPASSREDGLFPRGGLIRQPAYGTLGACLGFFFGRILGHLGIGGGGHATVTTGAGHGISSGHDKLG